jgi:GT2 family glycosyltransferase/glycosyltransferase involved in cell wall biosynthesis
MQIVVLGMHRSGTSAVTRLINLMGAYVGPEQSLGAPASDNEKGFWERLDVKDLNEAVLTQLGRAWDDPLGLDLGAIEGTFHDEFLHAAGAIVGEMNEHGTWVMKDPRLCLVMPLWRRLIERPIFVHVFRPPLEVARSLRARNGFALAKGVALWEAYTVQALRSSAGFLRVAVDFRKLMAEPVAFVSDLHERLTSVGVPNLRLPAEEEVRAFVDDRLYHQRSDSGLEDGLLNGAQSRLAGAMSDGSIFDWPEPPDLSATAEAILLHERARSEFQVWSQNAERAQAELLTRVDELQSASEAQLRAYENERAEIIKTAKQLHLDYEMRSRSEERARTELLATVSDLQRASEMQLRAFEIERVELVRAAERLRLESERKKFAELEKAVEELRGRSEQQAQAFERERLVLNEVYQTAQTDLRLLRSWLRQLDDAHAANVNSWRWRIGHTVVSLVERLLLRRRSPLAIERMTSLLCQFQNWQNESLDARTASPASGWHPSASIATASAPMSPARIPSRLIAEVLAAKTAKPDVLVFPIIDWHFRIQRPQHIAKYLARLGYRVFYFTTTPESNYREPGYEILESPEPGVFICKLFHDGPPLSIYDRPMDGIARDSLLASALMMFDQCAVSCAASIVDLPFWRPLAEVLPGAALIYDCMDHHAGFSTHAPEMEEEERKLLSSADVVVTTSTWLSESVGKIAPNTIIRNGAEVALFANAVRREATEPSRRPRVGYVGTIAEWFDMALVVAAAKAYPAWDFVLVGSTHGCDLNLVKGIPNIDLLGERPYAEVPGHVASFDVCLIPFKLTELIRATNPVKVYEYLSAGKPVVATDLPELRALRDLVHVATSEEAFIGELEKAMAERDDAILATARSEWAASQDWAARAAAFDELIRGCFPRVSVVVLTYNNLSYTKACLDSLQNFTRYPNWELIVVDNASSDGTPEFLTNYAEKIPGARVILNDTNVGFAAGNNIGIREASGDYVVILNNDTFVTQGWLLGLVRHMVKDEKLGLVGPVTNNIGNEAKIDIHYANMAEMADAARAYTIRHPRLLMETRVVAFFCVVLRRKVIDEIGLLDERFGTGFFEDDDYCRRVAAAGYKVAIAEDVFVHHHLSATFGEMAAERRKELFERNRAIYEKKWGSWEPHKYRS